MAAKPPATFTGAGSFAQAVTASIPTAIAPAASTSNVASGSGLSTTNTETGSTTSAQAQPARQQHLSGRGRKAAYKRSRSSNPAAAAFSDLRDQLDGAKDASHALAKEKKEAERTLAKLEKEFTKVDNELLVVKQTYDAQTTNAVCLHNFEVNVEEKECSFWMHHLLSTFFMCFLAYTCARETFWMPKDRRDFVIFAMYFPFVFVCKMLLGSIVVLLVSTPYHALLATVEFLISAISGKSFGMFGMRRKWKYEFIRFSGEIHQDKRTDANSVQELRHSAQYAVYKLYKSSSYIGCLKFFDFAFWIRNYITGELPLVEVPISCELLSQIATPKNIDPYLSPSDARAAINRSATHNSTVNVDRALIFQQKQVVLETVQLAFAMYLEFRQRIRRRDFLLPLPL